MHSSLKAFFFVAPAVQNVRIERGAKQCLDKEEFSTAPTVSQPVSVPCTDLMLRKHTNFSMRAHTEEVNVVVGANEEIDERHQTGPTPCSKEPLGDVRDSLRIAPPVLSQ